MIHAATVLIGDKLGLYKAMADGEPVTAEELAERTATDERYMRDPVGAAEHVRRSLKPDGTWMIVEPNAASTTICAPASKDQEVGLALGAQAGEARMREVVTAGGFSSIRRAAEMPFNLVFEARP